MTCQSDSFIVQSIEVQTKLPIVMHTKHRLETSFLKFLMGMQRIEFELAKILVGCPKPLIVDFPWIRHPKLMEAYRILMS